MADFSQPELFSSVRHLRRHEASSFLIAIAALERDLSVVFYRNRIETITHLSRTRNYDNQAIYFEISNGKRTHFFDATLSDKINKSAMIDTKNKLTTKAIFNAKRIRTPIGGHIRSDRQEMLSKLLDSGVGKFVIKPVSGSLGKNTYLNLNAEQVSHILNKNVGKDFIIEQYIDGQEHRLFVVGRQVCAAIERTAAMVVGDGKASINLLCDIRQKSRAKNPTIIDRTFDKADAEVALIMAGKKWTDVPEANEIVWLSSDRVPKAEGNRSWSLDRVPASMKQLAIDAMQSLSARSGALDMILAPNGEAFVLEVNLRAMISGLSFPWPDGNWNLLVPTAILNDLFGGSIKRHRRIANFDFSALRNEIFRLDRRTKGVNAESFAIYV